MDDELNLLEEELKALRPVSPSPALRETVGNLLEKRVRSRVRYLAFMAVPLAAAAVWVMAVDAGRTKSLAQARKRSESPAFKPVAAQNLLVASQDEGYVTLANGTTARRVRQTYLDTFTWKNPHTQASLRWTVPREEVRVVPISYQ